VKFTKYDIEPDLNNPPEYEARCAEGECPADSGPLASCDAVSWWKAEHTRATGHTRYRLVVATYEVWAPAETDFPHEETT